MNLIQLIPAVFAAFALISCSLYVVLIAKITSGWHKLLKKPSQLSDADVVVSVIVPARNEESNIIACLNSLIQQDYPRERLEIIVVDDHSEDTTAHLVTTFAAQYAIASVKFISLISKQGKKAALQAGIDAAKGELIFFTDADTIRSSQWLKAMVSCFEHPGILFVSGPVLLTGSQSWWSMLQQLEFASLVASGAGSIGAGMPVMSNGANLGFRKAAYPSLGHQALNPAKSSGDDVFLMLSFAKARGAGCIGFAVDKDALVTTPALVNTMGWLKQRIRWASKSTGYRSPVVIASAFTVFLMNAAVTAGLCLSFCDSVFLLTTIALLAVKTLIDRPLLVSFTQWYGKPIKIYRIILAEPMVAIMTIGSALAGLFIKPSWKGRRVH